MSDLPNKIVSFEVFTEVVSIYQKIQLCISIAML